MFTALSIFSCTSTISKHTQVYVYQVLLIADVVYRFIHKGATPYRQQRQTNQNSSENYL